MKKRHIILIAFLLITAATYEPAFAATLSCEGGIISVGDTRADVLAKCGSPNSEESHEEELIDRISRGERRKLFVTVEDWTYDFGPTRFTRIVTLKNGRVADIRSGKYGYAPSPPAQRECTEQVVSVGDAKSDVVAQCGEPSFTDTRQEEISERLVDGRIRRTSILVDEWTYNLGPNRFMRILTFKNGILSDIRTGGYGHDVRQNEKRR